MKGNKHPVDDNDEEAGNFSPEKGRGKRGQLDAEVVTVFDQKNSKMNVKSKYEGDQVIPKLAYSRDMQQFVTNFPVVFGCNVIRKCIINILVCPLMDAINGTSLTTSKFLKLLETAMFYRKRGRLRQCGSWRKGRWIPYYEKV